MHDLSATVSDQSTCSSVDHRVRALVWLVNDLARQTPDSAGRTPCVSSARSAPAGWSGRIRPVWETRQAVLFSMPSRRKWPKWGIRWGAANGALPTLALPTAASVFSLSGAWPSPRASDGEKGGPNQRGSKGDLMLPSAVQRAMWPTPASADAQGGKIRKDISATGRLPGGRKGQVSLNNAIKLDREQWPTPTQAVGLGGPGNSGRGGGENLRTAAAATGGSLSYRWVSLLMALPQDYLSIPPLPGPAGRRVQAKSNTTSSRHGLPEESQNE